MSSPSFPEYHLFPDGEGRQCLHPESDKTSKPLRVDFDDATSRHRLRTLSRKGLEARAIGLPRYGLPLHLLDATAGFGQDALGYAYLGCRVTLLERHPGMASLLTDAHARLSIGAPELAARMRVLHANAIEQLTVWPADDIPDVIYMDPMYPERRKRALGSLDMRQLRVLVGDDVDAAELLARARKLARRRVVVKRPRLAEILADAEPDVRYEGRAVRYDVYISFTQTAAGSDN